jgi:hypothetical protein
LDRYLFADALEQEVQLVAEMEQVTQGLWQAKQSKLFVEI